MGTNFLHSQHIPARIRHDVLSTLRQWRLQHERFLGGIRTIMHSVAYYRLDMVDYLGVALTTHTKHLISSSMELLNLITSTERTPVTSRT